MIPTILVMGPITIVSVSLEKVSEATVKMKQVNIVVANCNCASYTF